MHNLALALHFKGYYVTGSDDAVFEPSKSRLQKQGLLPAELGWFPEKITADIEAIILGMHAKADNPELLRAKQRQFDRTGGIHATGLFTPAGALVELREDIGRHNAMDKAIGARLMAGQSPLHDTVALVSGRAGFELVQKAAVAGIPIVAAVGAPSSIAVQAAELTLALLASPRPARGGARVLGSTFIWDQARVRFERNRYSPSKMIIDPATVRGPGCSCNTTNARALAITGSPKMLPDTTVAGRRFRAALSAVCPTTCGPRASSSSQAA